MPSPALKPVSESSHIIRYEGAFNQTTPWRGPPSDEIDQRWEDIIELRMFPLSNNEARDLGIEPRGYAQIPRELQAKYGSGILAGNEFSHQLHCLNLMRKYLSFDYYNAKPEEVAFNATSQILHTHVEHCIDILRQNIMCQPDTGFYPVYWIEGRPVAMPDFSTQRKCRNFDRLLQWARDHSITEPLESHPGIDDMVWLRGSGPQRRLST
ncbi:hypothetical protein ACHAQJ_010749 [Trichoderma viride]